MDELEPIDSGDERTQVRWWFPAMFGVSVVAAAIAVFAWAQRSDEPSTTDPSGLEGSIPELSQLGTNAPQVEDPAPGFAVETFTGDTFSLSEHLATDGRPVVLNLWASWCAPCRKEMPAISAAAEKHTDVLFLGVAVQDSLGDAAAFANEIGVAYPLAFDEGDVVNDGYNPLGLPATFFIDTDGGIVSRYFGELFEETLDEQIELAFGT